MEHSAVLSANAQDFKIEVPLGVRNLKCGKFPSIGIAFASRELHTETGEVVNVAEYNGDDVEVAQLSTMDVDGPACIGRNDVAEVVEVLGKANE